MCLYVCAYLLVFVYVCVCVSVSVLLQGGWALRQQDPFLATWLLGPDPFLAAISNLASPIANMVRACDACCPPEDQQEENAALNPP